MSLLLELLPLFQLHGDPMAASERTRRALSELQSDYEEVASSAKRLEDTWQSMDQDERRSAIESFLGHHTKHVPAGPLSN